MSKPAAEAFWRHERRHLLSSQAASEPSKIERRARDCLWNIEPFDRLWHKWDMGEAQRDAGSKALRCVDLQELIELYGDRLLRSAYLLCGDETEAQDLAQETLLQALKSAHRFRGDSATYTWLHGILLNLCHRHLRKQKRFVFEEEIVLKQSFESRPSSEADREVCTLRLTQAVRSLSPEHHEVIVLRYYENLKIQEIAQRIGVSNGTVKSRIHYAVRRLEKLIPAEMNLFVSEGTHDRVT